MIDGIKIKVKHPDIPGIRNNPSLEWSQTINERTGEIKGFKAVYHCMTFQIVAGRYLYISGSLHKHWNSINGQGEQNYNDFSRDDLSSTVETFCKTFDLVPDNCKIENIEFGVNVTPPVPVTDILNAVIHHKGKPFSFEQTNTEDFWNCTHSQYYIKFYDKGLRFSQGNILRFEVKTRKMEYISLAKIQTLSDLLKCENLTVLGAMLKDDFSMILFDDPTVNTSTMNHRDGMTFERCRNPKYWKTLKRDNLRKKRDRFKTLCKKYGSLDIQGIVYPLIITKWNELLYPTGKTFLILTGSSSGGENANFPDSDTLSIGSKPGKYEPAEQVPGSPPRRYCLSCGRDITDQRPGTKFCSAKVVGYVEAHRCRNRDSNPRNRIRYMKDRELKEPTLFDTSPLFIKWNPAGRDKKTMSG